MTLRKTEDERAKAIAKEKVQMLDIIIIIIS
jgi:hypothetical protein